MKKRFLLILCIIALTLYACGGVAESGDTLSENVDQSAAVEQETNEEERSPEAEFENQKGYPYYYSSLVEEYIEKVNAEFEAIGDHGFGFCFVTDQHTEDNSGYTPYIIKDIYDATPLELVLNGGDFFNRDKTKEGGIAKLEGCVNAFDFLEIPMFTTLGNHDLSESYNANDPDAYLTMEEFYEHAMSQMEQVTYYDQENGKYHYFYYDEDTKTYLICLQTGGSIVDSVPTSFLKADALVLKDLLPELDGNIIIFTHQLNTVDSEFSHNNSWKRLVSAIQASDCVDKVKLIVSGHTHTDLSDDSEGLLHVVTTTNSHKYFDETVGTKDELAFDTFFVDYENGTVKVLRFGRGEDRSFEIPE